MSQFLAPNIFERLAYFSLNFLLVVVKGLAFENFGNQYFYESPIFDKQQGELPYLQYPSSVNKINKF
jgi:hypothetical protein